MNDLLLRLKPNQRKGSKPRCHLLTHGSPEQVAERLSRLIAPWGSVAPTDRWMPQGFEALTEAQLHDAPRLLDINPHGEALKKWWLAVTSDASMTPNWDIASTCTIGAERGLVLVEAKAHDAELRNEERGKPLEGSNGQGVSTNSRRNHVRIGACIQDASLALSGETGLPWALSRDWNYQMANRFAWSWKLASLGIPVILVYLGFLDCREMQESDQLPFAKHEEWERLVKDHSAALFSAQVWDQRWTIHGQALIPIIRAMAQPLGEKP